MVLWKNTNIWLLYNSLIGLKHIISTFRTKIIKVYLSVIALNTELVSLNSNQLKCIVVWHFEFNQSKTIAVVACQFLDTKNSCIFESENKNNEIGISNADDFHIWIWLIDSLIEKSIP